jgi:WD40 repeat protein
MTDHGLLQKKRVSLIDMFSCPDNYKPPDDAGLATCTEYPNQNSREYRKKLVDQSPMCLPFFEIADINHAGQFILGTNNYRGRIWNGWGWGFDLADDVGDAKKSIYKFHSNGSITNLKFVEDNIFLMSNAQGQIDLWSTKSMVNSPDSNYCLFSIGSRHEHTSIVSGLDILPGKTKAVSGDKDGSLKVWDMGQANLVSYQTFYGAHSDEVTAITACGSAETVFGTASRDRSLLIWDYRQPRPATGECKRNFLKFIIHFITKENYNNFNSLMTVSNLSDRSGPSPSTVQVPTSTCVRPASTTNPVTMCCFCAIS